MPLRALLTSWPRCGPITSHPHAMPLDGQGGRRLLTCKRLQAQPRSCFMAQFQLSVSRMQQLSWEMSSVASAQVPRTGALNQAPQAAAAAQPDSAGQHQGADPSGISSGRSGGRRLRSHSVSGLPACPLSGLTARGSVVHLQCPMCLTERTCNRIDDGRADGTLGT